MIVIAFALPDEARAFLPALEQSAKKDRHPLSQVSGQCAGRAVRVVYTGVGATADGSQRLCAALDGLGPEDLLISSGFAGALRGDLKVGDLVLGENFSDPRLAGAARRLLADEPTHVGGLSTQSLMAERPADKSALAAATGAIAVDMETGWIAEACARAGVPMVSLRVVSDAADQPFPVPGTILFDALRQRPRYFALPAWLLAHPWQIGPFAQFVRGLAPARARLSNALQILVAHLPKGVL
jgi:adenosylhomocysteine nucleosidase